MKSKLITVFIISALSALGLCSTVSSAADKAFFINSSTQSNTHVIPSAHATTIMMLSKNIEQKILLNTSTVEHLINKPLFTLTSPAQFEEYIPSKTFKKNELFELATIFNDKLQQVLSFLGLTRSITQDGYFNADKPNDYTTIEVDADCNT